MPVRRRARRAAEGLRRRLRAEERGSIVVIVAVAMPIFVLFAALVIDIGNWKEKDRNLQTRADAAALAAGVEYVAQLRACLDPATKATAATAIKGSARTYAGATGATGPQNQGINEQSRVWVGVNTTTYGGAEDTDGAATVCDPHNPADAISPGDTPPPCPDPTLSPSDPLYLVSCPRWVDVKMTESDIPSFFGSLGFPLSQVNARARVELKQILGIRERGLPFVNETGEQVECVWAQFVRASDGVVNGGFTATPNPALLTKDPVVPGQPYTWSASGVNLKINDSAARDIAVRYWFGAKDGSSPCVFSTANKGPVPRDWDDDTTPTAGIDWINVWDDSASVGANEAPKLRRFALTKNNAPDDCGGPGLLYTASLASNKKCRINFTADVETSTPAITGSITVEVANNPDDRADQNVTPPETPASVTVNWVPVPGSKTKTVTGTIVLDPNKLRAGSSNSQDYTQVGQLFFRVKYDQTSGKVGSKDCPGGVCSGTFSGETIRDQYGNNVTDVQHMAYMYDPLTTSPLLDAELSFESSLRGAPTVEVTFDISVKHTATDQEHIVVFRDSVQSSGNRTKAIYCGNPPGKGAAALEDAVVNGCAKGLISNSRNDSCSPGGSPSGTAGDPWDCVQIEQGNKSSLVKGFEDRFLCSYPNNWAAARAQIPPEFPPESDKRWAYIILTDYGRTFAAANNDWLPIAGLLRVYVTGWDKQGGGGGPANCSGNDDPPRGYDSKGAQIWGHVVEPIVIDPAVIVGDGTCDTSKQNIQCKPILVR